jgi:hypothetical protein
MLSELQKITNYLKKEYNINDISLNEWSRHLLQNKLIKFSQKIN